MSFFRREKIPRRFHPGKNGAVDWESENIVEWNIFSFHALFTVESRAVN
jgi:hypothetical protein